MSPFLRARRKVTQRRAPDENSSRRAWSSSVHFGNLPRGRYLSAPLPPGAWQTASHSPKCFTLVLGRPPKFSYGTALSLCPNPARPRMRPLRDSPGNPSWSKAASPRANAHVRGRRPSLRGRADVTLDGSGISFRTRRGCAKNAASRVLFLRSSASLRTTTPTYCPISIFLFGLSPNISGA